MNMSTADALRVRLAGLHQAVDQERQGYQSLDGSIDEAKERQELRRQVEETEGVLAEAKHLSDHKRTKRTLIDQDILGEHQPTGGRPPLLHLHKPPVHTTSRQQARTTTDINSVVERGELTWDIKGFSWLKTTLQQEADVPYCRSCDIDVAGHKFIFVYHPHKGWVDDVNQRASLAILHHEPLQYAGVAFRYKVFIESSQRGFVQWGESGDECVLDDAEGIAFGPDVCSTDDNPAGIFNMNHDELLSSEWVSNDTLTAKFQVEVRPRANEMVLRESSVEPEVQVLPSTIIQNFLSLLDDASSSDVSFVVQGELMKAHSLILSARSEVFRLMLNCGMRESASKEVVIDDCEPKLFQAMLRFLYSDCFDFLEEVIGPRAADDAFGSSECSVDQSQAGEKSTRLRALLNLLAMSHKYQLARLQSWCARELCICVTVEDVCSVLCQAHLYEAKQLEQVCIRFVKARMDKVAQTSSFGTMGREWPEVMMKISICSAGLPVEAAAAVIAAQHSSGKRKRED
jgi:hypothetical protein